MKAVPILKRKRNDPVAALLDQRVPDILTVQPAVHPIRVVLCRTVHLQEEVRTQMGGFTSVVICLEGFDTRKEDRYVRVYMTEEGDVQSFCAALEDGDGLLATVPRRQEFLPVASLEAKDPDGQEFTALLLGPWPDRKAVMKSLGLLH